MAKDYMKINPSTYLSSDDFPKTVDLCGTDKSLAHKSDCREWILICLIQLKASHF